MDNKNFQRTMRDDKIRGPLVVITGIILIFILLFFAGTEIEEQLIIAILKMPNGIIKDRLQDFIKANSTTLFLEPIIQLVKHPSCEIHHFPENVLIINCKQRFSPFTISKLIQLSKNKDSDIQMMAMLVLSNYATNSNDYEPCKILLADKDPEVRKGALGTFQTFSSTIASPLIDSYISLLSDPDDDIRLMAVRDLEYSSEPGPVDPLINCLTDKHPKIRAGACSSLGSLCSSLKYCTDKNINEKTRNKPVDMLIKALNDKDSDVRISAVYALEKIGDPQGLSALKKIIADPGQDKQTVEAAKRALNLTESNP